MENEEDRVEELEQLLRDERALRMRAESRAAEQAEKASIWRTRAEERADRIQRLLAEPKRRRGRRARSDQPVRAAAEPPITAEKPRRSSRLAGVMVAAAAGDPHGSLLAPFAAERGVDALESLAEADLVVVDGPNLRRLEASDATSFAEWLGLQGRQPLVLFADATTDADSAWVAQADLVVGEDIGRFNAIGIPTMPLVPSFDPSVDNPIGRAPSPLDPAATSDFRDGTGVLHSADGTIVGIEAADLSQPPEWLVAAAARGVPISGANLGNDSPLELSRASTAARRWAYRHHTTTKRAAEIARRAGLDIRNPQPHATAVLVSMRPDQAATALDMVRHQTYRPLSVVVGLHGANPTPEFTKSVDRIGDVLPTVVLEFPERFSLGECLNRAIDASSGEILTKIDDDDFYGPAHIEDGVQAIEYSGAGIVGKGAQFTYVEAEDRTVLRRQREQETFLGGSPTGATMLIQRHIWEQVGFPHRPRQVDVLFTRAARHNGSQVYAASPWEFCYVRTASSHTWTTAPETFLAGTDAMWNGFSPERTVVPDLVQGLPAQ
ncbi:MAG: hypothetical protein QNJ89_11670 [Acidimicrobiia bacterium]|nr:hypothetical protein [Acidimicrobiia bacterium]